MALLNDDQDDDDLLFGGFDSLEFNMQMNEAILSVQTIREFTHQIKYREQSILQMETMGMMNEISPDGWFNVFEYLPFVEFGKISLVCSAFAEIITFNGRYLTLKQVLNDYSGFFRPTYSNVQQAVSLLAERGKNEGTNWTNDLLVFYVERERIKDGLWEYWNDPLMKEEMILNQFKIINKRNVEQYFNLFHNIPNHLKENREFVMKLLKCSNYTSMYFVFLDDKLKRDREIMKISVQGNGFILKYMNSKGLPFDGDIAMEAVKCKFRRNFNYSVDNYLDPRYFSTCDVSVLQYTNHLVEITPELVHNEFKRSFTKKSRAHMALGIAYEFRERLDILEWLLSIVFFTSRDYDACLSILKLYASGMGVNSFFDIFNGEIPEWLFRTIQICPQFKLQRMEFTLLEIVKKIIFRCNIVFWELLEKQLNNNLLDFIKSITLEIGVSPNIAKQINNGQLLNKCIDKSYGEKFIRDLLSNYDCVRKMIGVCPELYWKLEDSTFKEDPIIKRLSEYKLSRIEFPVSDEKLLSLFTDNPLIVKRLFTNRNKWLLEIKKKLESLAFIRHSIPETGSEIVRFSPQIIQQRNPLAAMSLLIGENTDIWRSISEDEWHIIMKNSTTSSTLFFINQSIIYCLGFYEAVRKLAPIAKTLKKHPIVRRLKNGYNQLN